MQRKRPVRTVCRKCNRNITIAVVRGEPVELDPELITVSPMAGGVTLVARRVHAEKCTEYQEAQRRERIAREKKEYEAANGRKVEP